MCKKNILIALVFLFIFGCSVLAHEEYEPKINPAHLAYEKDEPKFIRSQYDMLKHCSEKKDATEWNQWRIAHPEEDILLQRANLVGFYLEEVNLQGAYLRCADLQDAWLHGANLQDADLMCANLKGASLWDSNLQGADLMDTNLQGAWLQEANLQDVALAGLNLKGAMFARANLKGAWLESAYLQGADLRWAKLQGAVFKKAIVDGSTLIWDCEVDKKTDFRGVGLGDIRIDSKTKQFLEYNIRRMNWEDWYKGHNFLQWPTRIFWWISDYGVPTYRVALSFLITAIFFSIILCVFGLIGVEVVEGLFKERRYCSHISLKLIQKFLFRAFYFSVVTMTTLGFGDMRANRNSIIGQIIVIFQVVSGYVLLGALVTRLGILFTASGPA